MAINSFVFFLHLGLLLPIITALSPTVRLLGEWTACRGAKGVCINIGTYSCSSTTKTNLCNGPTAVRCCPYPSGVSATKCTALKGVCVRTEQCSRSTISRLCPGPGGITCCPSGGSTPPKTTPPSNSNPEWSSCRGRAGVCINVSRYRCSASTVKGICQGGSNIQCCAFPNGVQSGKCFSQRTGLCKRSSDCRNAISGKCPGPAGIKCCPSTTTISNPSGCRLGTVSTCSTAVANGLTRQLIQELNRMGISFSSFNSGSRISCGSPCQPYLQSVALTALKRVTSSRGGTLSLTSAYRSSAQQYLLYRWFLNGKKCGVKLAAKPGRSNHEGGLAIDTRAYNSWKSSLKTERWQWFGSRDPVHFTYQGGRSGVPLQSLRAFQRLWNRNNPSDKIAEDGLYGQKTALRLSKAPCGGWWTGLKWEIWFWPDDIRNSCDRIRYEFLRMH